MQPPQAAHGIGVAGVPGAELDIPLPHKRRDQIANAVIKPTPTANSGRPVMAKTTVPMTPATLVIRKWTLNMPRSNWVTGGMSSLTSRKAGDARKK